MGFGRTRAVALTGVEGHLVVVEAQGSHGLPAFIMGGLPDAACAQAPDRVRAAAGNSGVGIPMQRWTVNLSPASLPKVGSGFDLANAAQWRSCLQETTMTTTDTMSTTTALTVEQPIHDSRPQPQTIPCTPWCDSKDTSDESCIGQEHVTTLSLHNRVEWSDGQWTDEWASAYPCTNRTHIDPGYIHLGIGEATGMRLTPAEARSIAAALVATADEMEGRR